MKNDRGPWVGYVILLATTMVWGSAFIPQKTAMSKMDPMLFTAVRFFMGSAFLLPFAWYFGFRRGETGGLPSALVKHGAVAGLSLAFGAGLQQIGLQYTHIANAGFLTSFYIILVPLLAFFLGRRIGKKTYSASLLAIIGIFFLSFNEKYLPAYGDIIVFASSFFWACHILLVEKSAKKLDNFSFSSSQFFFCGLFSFLFSLALGENIALQPVLDAWPELLYGGVVSVGIGYTLQVFGQKKIPAEYSAIIFSLEAVFALFFEVLIFDVFPSMRGLFGCSLIFAAVIYSQWNGPKAETR